MPFGSLETATPSEQHEKQRNGNQVTITKENGIFTVVYGKHSVVEANIDLKGISNVCPETGDNDYVKNPEYIAEMLEKGSYGYTQCVELFSQLKLFYPSTPVVFGDLAFKDGLNSKFFTAEYLAMIGESALGAKLLYDVYRESGDRLPVENKRHVGDVHRSGMTRREFLKYGLGLTAGIYMTSPLVTGMSRAFLPRGGDLGEVTADITKVVVDAHPEQFVLSATIRNCVIAEKLEWLAERGFPRPALYLGAMHVGIETALEASSAERIAFLNTVVPFVKQLVIPECFYTAVGVKHQDDRFVKDWEVAIPTLETLLNH